MITVNAQEDKLVRVSSFQPLAIGSLIRFDDVINGYVTRFIQGQSYEVCLTENQLVKAAQKLTWWAPTISTSDLHVPAKYFIKSEEAGKMKVPCKRALSGYLTWKLFHNATLIATGNDLKVKGWCELDVPGLFPEGRYCLEVSQITKATVIGRGRANWLVEQPTNLLECGLGKTCPVVDVR